MIRGISSLPQALAGCHILPEVLPHRLRALPCTHVHGTDMSLLTAVRAHGEPTGARRRNILYPLSYKLRCATPLGRRVRVTFIPGAHEL